MNETRKNMKFIKTNSSEVAKRLRLYGFTEIPGCNSSEFCFVNDGKKIIFDVDENDYVYTNILCI